MSGIGSKEIANANSTCTPHEQEACLYMCTTYSDVVVLKEQGRKGEVRKTCRKESDGVSVIGRR